MMIKNSKSEQVQISDTNCIRGKRSVAILIYLRVVGFYNIILNLKNELTKESLLNWIRTLRKMNTIDQICKELFSQLLRSFPELYNLFRQPSKILQRIERN